jgi:hypothetical protein
MVPVPPAVQMIQREKFEGPFISNAPMQFGIPRMIPQQQFVNYAPQIGIPQGINPINYSQFGIAPQVGISQGFPQDFQGINQINMPQGFPMEPQMF